jgi:dephospho-CoA kinase|tara:strand:- start:765 stop:1541 length:777 start_codon:yes stop_codon:yes gene_type:complete
MIIGITGSFGSGKTTVANMFGKYGFKVINADKLYHGIYNKDKSIRNKIKKEFGTINRNQLKKIVFNDSKKLKKLNDITHPIIIKEIKKEISAMIKRFNKKNSIIKKDYNKKHEKISKKFSVSRKLQNNFPGYSIINKNNIKFTDKKIKNNYNKKLVIGKNSIENQKNVNIVLDIPLLFEAKTTNLVDKIIVVRYSKKEQIKRILKKKKYNKTEINQIIKSQMPLKEKIKKADFVINNKTIKEAEKQVKDVIKVISEKV